MPQIFPAWMTSPVVMYGVPLILVVLLLRYIVTGNWRGLRRYLGVLLVLALVGYTAFTGYMKYLFKDFQWQMPPAVVMVQPVETLTFADRIEAVGTTEANESSKLTSNVTETVKEIYFTEGQFVTKGTILVQLHDDEERATLVEAEKSFGRSAELVRTSAISAARRDQDRARLDVARAQVRDRQIVAPFDGILGLRSISVGDIVNPGTVITTLDDVNPIKLEFSVPEIYMAAVKSGMAIEATSEAYHGEVFKGVITAIDPRIDPVTRTLRIKAEIDNQDGRLRAGMLLNTNIVRNERQSLAVSEEALVSQGTQKMVMIAGTPEGTGDAQVYPIEARPVTIGTRMPGYVEVISGLKAGEKVVVDGVIKAHPGAKVKVVGEKTIDATVKRALDNAVPGKQEELDRMPLPSADNAVPAINAASSEPTPVGDTSAMTVNPQSSEPDAVTSDAVKISPESAVTEQPNTEQPISLTPPSQATE